MALSIAPVHQFSAIHRRLRDEWFALVETPDQWTDQGPIGEGESQSIRVHNRTNGLTGAAKPGPNVAAQEDHCRAANEKVAFDLSCLVGVTVCPVVLWGMDAPAVYKRGRSISAWAFPQSDQWQRVEALGVIDGPRRTQAAEMISAMRVFHSWIGDSDRKESHIHVDLNSPPGELLTAFYDHANALSHTWSAAGAPLGLCPDYMAPRGVPVIADVMVETANVIASLPDDDITRVVSRVPTIYLPDAKRATMISNLLSRKTQLRALLP